MSSSRRRPSERSPPRPRKKHRTSGTAETVPLAFQQSSVVAAVQTATHNAVSSPDAAVTILRDAQVIHLTDDGASWLYYIPRWYQGIHCGTQEPPMDYDAWFDAVWHLHPPECGTIKLFGKEIRTPRFQHAYGVTHRFSGATFDAKPFPDLLTQAVATIQRMLVDPATDATLLTAGLLNWYADGAHYMGPHSDAGVNIRRDSPIFSLTLGPATRRFVVTPRASKDKTVEFQLSDGDLLVMGGTTQATHKHALPKTKQCHARRVNLTLRYFS